MNNLDSMLPKSRLVERFGKELILEEYGKPDLATIARLKPAGLHEIGGCVWNRIVHKRWHAVAPTRVANSFRSRDPYLYEAISKLLAIEVIRDIYYAKGWRRSNKKRALVVELLVAHVYRNDLHLGDITFIDPDQPIPEGQRFAFQTHKGLGLLPTFLESFQQKAEELNCEQMTLIAAATDQMKLFGRYGFEVDDSPLARLGLLNGNGIPMEKDVI